MSAGGGGGGGGGVVHKPPLDYLLYLLFFCYVKLYD
jgi:hypothetical protein